MAEQVVHEPKVSVHGIPKSEYDSSGGKVGGPPIEGDSGGGNIVDNIKQHWRVYAIMIAVGFVVFVLFIYSRTKQTVSAPGDSSVTGTTPGDQLYGAQLDADYQQMMYNQNTTTGLLQQLLNKQDTPPTTTPPTTTTPPVFKAQTLFPDQKHTAGESDNFWVYTTKMGDTLASVTGRAKWGSDYAKFEGYRNNNAILSQIGYPIGTPTTVIPTGTKLSL